MLIKKSFAAVGAAVVCAGVLAACGGDDDDNNGAAASTPSTSPSTTSGSGASTTSAGTGAVDPSKPKVKIAVFSSQDPSSDLLTYFDRGATSAAKAINAKGGFGGREVVIQPCNSKFQPPVATLCAQKAISQGVVGMIGCELAWSSSGLKLFERAKIPSVNCLNTPEDYSNPWSFGLNSGDTGQTGAIANWLCTKPDVKTVGLLKPDLPQLRINAPLAQKILKACGKTLQTPVWFPLTAVDATPYVQKATSAKPDFMYFSFSGPGVATFMKSFQAAGYPADQIVMPDTDFPYTSVVKPAESAFVGSYAAAQFTPYGDESDPQVQQYLKDTQAAGVDGKDPTTEWGYALVMWYYTAAQKIGFDKFDGPSFQQYMTTASGVPIPLSKDFTSPGPPKFPQNRQPFVQISQYTGNGKFQVLPVGDAGCFWAYGPKP